MKPRVANVRSLVTSALIVCTVCVARTPSQAQSPEAGIDLSGVGTVQVETDRALFAPYSDYILQRFQSDVVVYFDADGHATDCRPINDAAPAGFTDLLCRELLAKAHLELPAGYDLAGQSGFLPVRASGTAAQFEAIEPIAFAPAEGGQEVTVFTAAPPNLARGPCMVMEGDLGAALSARSKTAICSAFQSGGERIQRKCSPDSIEREVAQRWRCSILTRPVPAGKSLEVTLRERAIEPVAPPVYPPLDLPEDRLLAPGSATLRLPMSEDDYPLLAIRYAWEGRSEILFGMAEGDARIVSCRPIRSSGYPVLDNTACKLALRRGRVIVSPGDEGPSGVRYLRQNIGWRMP